MDATRQTALIIAVLFSTAAFAWDVDSCASTATSLKEKAEYAISATGDAQEARNARDRDDAMRQARTALQQVEETLWQARRDCGPWGQSALGLVQSTIDNDAALRQIDEWSARMKKSDPRYAQVEGVLMRRVDLLVKALPSQYWLSTLQMMYAAVSEAAQASQPPALQRF